MKCLKKNKQVLRGREFNPVLLSWLSVSVARELWFTIQASQEHLSHEIHEMSRKKGKSTVFVNSKDMGIMKGTEGLTLYSFRVFRAFRG